MKYYRILDGFHSKSRWYLGTPKAADGSKIDPRAFTCCHWWNQVGTLHIPVSEGVIPLDFTLGAFDMPVVISRIGELIQEIAPRELQRIRATIEGQPDTYEVLNVLKLLPAIDERLSEIRWWTAEDGNPKRVGTYFSVSKIVLKEDIVADASIFRLKGWELPLIVSEKVKRELDHLATSGITFQELSTATPPVR